MPSIVALTRRLFRGWVEHTLAMFMAIWIWKAQEFPTVHTTEARHTRTGAISALSCTTDRKAIVLATFAITGVPFVTGVAHTRTVTVTRAVCRTIIWAKFKTTIRLSEPSITVTLACVPTRATARAVFRTG